jgi:hypothetical protein
MLELFGGKHYHVLFSLDKMALERENDFAHVPSFGAFSKKGFGADMSAAVQCAMVGLQHGIILSRLVQCKGTDFGAKSRALETSKEAMSFRKKI